MKENEQHLVRSIEAVKPIQKMTVSSKHRSQKSERFFSESQKSERAFVP
jgi:hypothetical protein